MAANHPVVDGKRNVAQWPDLNGVDPVHFPDHDALFKLADTQHR